MAGGTGAGDLFALADAYLGVLADALDTILDTEPDLVGAPERQLVSHGLPVFDCCDQLAVELQVLEDAPLTPNIGKFANIGRVPHVTLVGWATRCVPSIVEDARGGISIPTATELHESGRQLMADSWSLYNHVYNAVRSGDLLTLCSEAFFVGVQPVIPSGGCAGSTVTVRFSLDGYETESIGS